MAFVPLRDGRYVVIATYVPYAAHLPPNPAIMPIHISINIQRRSSNHARPVISPRHRIQAQPFIEIRPIATRPSNLYRASITPRPSSRASPSPRPHLARSSPPSYSSTAPPLITADKRPPKYTKKDPYGTRWRRFCKRLRFYRKLFVRFVYIGVRLLIFVVGVLFAIPVLLLCAPYLLYLHLQRWNQTES